MFTCEYCFSHYVAAIILVITEFKLLYPDWRGYLVSWFALVWVSNMYMGAFARLHLDIRQERLEIQTKDLDLQSKAEALKSNVAAKFLKKTGGQLSSRFHSRQWYRDQSESIRLKNDR